MAQKDSWIRLSFDLLEATGLSLPLSQHHFGRRFNEIHQAGPDGLAILKPDKTVPSFQPFLSHHANDAAAWSRRSLGLAVVAGNLPHGYEINFLAHFYSQLLWPFVGPITCR